MSPSEIYIGGNQWAMTDGDRIRLRSGPADDPRYAWLDDVAFNVIQALVRDMRHSEQERANG